MTTKSDDQYYLLGRSQGFNELHDKVTKPKPHVINMKHRADWQQGHEEAVATYYWRRKPVK